MNFIYMRLTMCLTRGYFQVAAVDLGLFSVLAISPFRDLNFFYLSKRTAWEKVIFKPYLHTFSTI